MRNARVRLSILLTILVATWVPFVLAEPGEDGVLYVYTDPYTTEADWYKYQHSYATYIGNNYWIWVRNIDDPNGVKPGDVVDVRVAYTDTSGDPAMTPLGTVTVQTDPTGGGMFQIGPWLVPEDAKICTTANVHFRLVSGGQDWIAGGQFFNLGHMHVIPEATFGVASSLIVCLGALLAFSGIRKKVPMHLPKL